MGYFFQVDKTTLKKNVFEFLVVTSLKNSKATNTNETKVIQIFEQIEYFFTIGEHERK